MGVTGFKRSPEEFDDYDDENDFGDFDDYEFGPGGIMFRSGASTSAKPPAEWSTLTNDELLAALHANPLLFAAMAGCGSMRSLRPRQTGREALRTTLAHPTSRALAIGSLSATAYRLARVAAWFDGTLTEAAAQHEAAGVGPNVLIAAADELKTALLASPSAPEFVSLYPDMVSAFPPAGISCRRVYSGSMVTNSVLDAKLKQLGESPQPTRALKVDQLEAILRDAARVRQVVGGLDAEAR